MTAIAGTFSDCKLVKSRSVMQLVIEVPIEQADAALKALGGVPLPGKERWVGIAPLQDKPSPAASALDEPAPSEQPKRNFHELSPASQAAIKCTDPNFRRFLTERNPSGGLYPTGDDAAEEVRRICGVQSRALLNSNPPAQRRWQLLVAEYEDYRLGRR